MEEQASVMSQFKQQLSNSQAAGFAPHAAFAVDLNWRDVGYDKSLIPQN